MSSIVQREESLSKATIGRGLGREMGGMHSKPLVIWVEIIDRRQHLQIFRLGGLKLS